MALVQEIGSTNGAVQTTIVTGTWPSGTPPAGHILVCIVTAGGNGSGGVTSPGWSAVTGTSFLTAGSGFFFNALYKVTGGSEAATYTFTSDHTNWQATQIFDFSGRNTSTPFTNALGTTGPAAAASPLSIALTGFTATAGDDVLWCAGLGVQSYASTQTLTVPSSPSGFGSGLVTQLTTTGFTPGIESAVNQNFSGGALGTVTGSTSWSGGGNMDYVGYVISLAAASGGPPPSPLFYNRKNVLYFIN